ncbi:hypothetical protein [uncultured Dokdonia sp.]|uniref:hypothetical protein n=1 Tax=uncultured Dokdonia sp. TaxID=575653 RepID=UPI0026078F77|nr:hypothetical protein [uncultured Dokdonia sp.]
MAKYYFSFIFISLFIFNLNAQQTKKIDTLAILEATLEKRIDSIINEKVKKFEKDIINERIKLNTINSEIVKYESAFWKEHTNWFIILFGALLALVPIYLAFMEAFSKKRNKKLKAITLSLDNAKKNITDFTKFQTYQELYFEDVLKPTINSITDILLELSLEERIDIELVEEITEKYYDFERVINLTHCKSDIQKSAVEYIQNRNSSYLKVKLETILNNKKISDNDSELKLLIHNLLNKYK